MKAVIDTNVLVSGILNPGSYPGRIVDMLRTSRVQAVVDDRILAEYADVLRRPYFRKYFSLSEADAMLDFLRHASQYVVCTMLADDLSDPGDTPFLEAALTAGVPLVTGNTRHFPSDRRRGCRVCTPRQFLHPEG